MRGRRLWLQAAVAVALLVTVALAVLAVEVLLVTHGSHSTGVTVTTTP